MATTLKSVEGSNGEIHMTQFFGGKEDGRCLQIFVVEESFYRPIELTVDQALELSKALIEFAQYKRESKSN